ncbi:hypothetical protein G8C93_06405 [Cellulosimicrobium cellulans]|uniref:hypothetical protein n=1 Tax=Cellulosimicrobium cellulans TaxID=1710 RepID=UPI0018832265|nr:hypothetical protein [Cellulosimicrobium cellulans]MBE9925521.1 hypothetical protein [Cellulosimicrobium cellulans]
MTEFAIEPHDAQASLDTAIDDTLATLGTWIGGDDRIAPADLLGDGERELVPTHGAARKYAEWSYVSASSDWATRAEVRTVASNGHEFVARVTIGRQMDTLRARVSLARETGATRLVPTQDAEVRQPRVISDLVRHPRLRVRVAGQGFQDGRYIQARGASEVEVVAQILREQERLPVLLVHTRTEEALLSVKRAAGGLVGLVRVVTLDLRSARILYSLESRAEVPYAGGLLVWADIEAPAVMVDASIVNDRDSDALRTLLMRQVAPLSVLARGVDETYRSVQRSAQSARSSEAAERTAAAVESGSQSEIVVALKQERDRAIEAEQFAIEQWELAETRAAAVAKEAARWKAEAEQQRVAAHYVMSGAVQAEALTWDNAPKLTVGDAGTLESLCQHLEQASQGRILFTANATAAWRKADRYATPDEMRTGLVKLAQVAYELYDGQGRSVGHVDTWVRENFDLKIALQDDAMPKSFRRFDFDNKRYDRTPHVKVNDGVPHHECGRVYFALDKENQRLIVDHVGLKY